MSPWFLLFPLSGSEVRWAPQAVWWMIARIPEAQPSITSACQISPCVCFQITSPCFENAIHPQRTCLWPTLPPSSATLTSLFLSTSCYQNSFPGGFAMSRSNPMYLSLTDSISFKCTWVCVCIWNMNFWFLEFFLFSQEFPYRCAFMYLI